jgi:hypothetical protein
MAFDRSHALFSCIVLASGEPCITLLLVNYRAEFVCADKPAFHKQPTPASRGVCKTRRVLEDSRSAPIVLAADECEVRDLAINTSQLAVALVRECILMWNLDGPPATRIIQTPEWANIPRSLVLSAEWMAWDEAWGARQDAEMCRMFKIDMEMDTASCFRPHHQDDVERMPIRAPLVEIVERPDASDEWTEISISGDLLLVRTPFVMFVKSLKSSAPVWRQLGYFEPRLEGGLRAGDAGSRIGVSKGLPSFAAPAILRPVVMGIQASRFEGTDADRRAVASQLSLTTTTDYASVCLPDELGPPHRFLQPKPFSRMCVIPEVVGPGCVHVHITDHRMHYLRVVFADAACMEM